MQGVRPEDQDASDADDADEKKGKARMLKV